MASIYDLKPAFQRLLQPVLRGLAAIGVTPNQITVIAVLLSVAGGALIATSSTNPELLIWVPVVLFVRMALNALDGMMARQYQQSSPLGEVLNEVGDIVSDVVLYLPLWALFPSDTLAVLLLFCFVFLAALSEFCGVLSKAMGFERRYDGPMGKSDRAFFIGLMALVLFIEPGWVIYASPVLGMGNLLLMLSCYRRLHGVLVRAGGQS